MFKKKVCCLVVSSVFLGSAQAADCLAARSYIVKPTSFARMDVDHAVQKLLGGTPLVLHESRLPVSHQVGADKISGNLGDLLEEMGKEVGFEWAQKGCEITLSLPVRVVSKNTEWIVTEGEDLEKTLSRWGAVDGWRVLWDIDEIGGLQVGASAKFHGTIQQAITGLIDAIALSGEKIGATFHAGNNLIRISRTK